MNLISLFVKLIIVILVLFALWRYMIYMPRQSFKGQIPALSKKENQIKKQVQQHVIHLASTLGERNIWNKTKLQSAESYIEGQFKEMGYCVSFQSFDVNGLIVKNIIAEDCPSDSNKDKNTDILIVGAHYDSVPFSPGADDNASGVAALLEIARVLKSIKTKRLIRFVAFVNEEPPFFYSKNMGSLRYTEQLKKEHQKIIGMISLESLGYYSDQKNSQKYPIFFNLFYPNKANFIGFVSNLSSRKLLHTAINAFRKNCPFPSEGVVAPSWLTGVGWSDHWAFWKQGYPAFMITDTALFRNPYYHTPKDKPETLDYDSFARVVGGVSDVVLHLANSIQ